MGSWIWRKLLKYRDIAKNFHRVEIGNGASTFFWYDVWSDLGRLWDLTGYRGVIHLGIPSAAKISQISNRRRRRHHRVVLLNQIEANLSQAHLQDSEDTHMWKNSKGVYKNSFSTKETWEALREQRPQVVWWRGIWFRQATPKYAFIAWLAARNRLSTGDRMLRWNVGVNPLCIFCSQDTESVNHLFFTCSYSQTVWRNLVGRLMLQRFTYIWRDLLRMVADKNVDRVYEFLLRYVFQTSIHLIWCERNKRKHGEAPMSVSRMKKAIEAIVRNRIFSLGIRIPNWRRQCKDGCMLETTKD